MHSISKLGVACVVLTLGLNAQTTMLTTGPGVGSISVTVDGMGAFGGCFFGDLLFETSTGPIPTTCGSAFILHEPSAGAPRPFASYATGGFPTPLPPPQIAVNVPGQDVQSTWTHSNYQINCRQRVFGPEQIGAASFEGSTLLQEYTITNMDTITHTLDFARWLDGDVGFGTQFNFNSAGATASVASLGPSGMPPFTGNGHVVFIYDQIYDFVVMTSMEVVDENNRAVEHNRWATYDNTAGGAWNIIGSSAAAGLPNSVNPDPNGDLLTDIPLDAAVAQGVTNLSISALASVTVVIRTRCSFLDASLTAPVWEQARNLSGTVYGGNYGGAGVQALLCINGQGGVSSVPGGNLTVSLDSPGALPNNPYVLFAMLGSPTTGNVCGATRTLDFAAWGAPFRLGLGAFPSGILGLGNWTGGGGLPSFPLASNVPGFGALVTPHPGGPTPCGTAILGPVAINQDAVITLQALIGDPAALLGVSISNAPAVAVGTCNVPMR